MLYKVIKGTRIINVNYLLLNEFDIAVTVNMAEHICRKLIKYHGELLTNSL